MSYWGRRQPPWGTPIDLEHPLAQGMVCAVIPAGSGGMGDALRVRTSIPPTTRSGGVSGQAIGDWTIPAAAIGDLGFTTGGWSVAAFFRVLSVPGNGQYPTIFGQNVYVNESNSQGWALGIRALDDSGHADKYVFNSSRNTLSYPNSNLVTGTATIGDHFLCGTSQPNTNNRRIYLDSGTPTLLSLSGNPLASAGALTNSSAGTGGVPLYVGYAWNRMLIDAEAGWLNAEPFAVWGPPLTNLVTFLMSPASILAGNNAPILMGY